MGQGDEGGFGGGGGDLVPHPTDLGYCLNLLACAAGGGFPRLGPHACVGMASLYSCSSCDKWPAALQGCGRLASAAPGDAGWAPSHARPLVSSPPVLGREELYELIGKE